MDIYKNLPININYGVVIYDAGNLDSNGESEVIHFIGLAYEPTDEELKDMLDEFIEENEEYADDSFTLRAQLADDEVLDVYRSEYINWIANQN